MSAGFSPSKCSSLLVLLFGILAAAGCESDGYSPAIRYVLRTDPLVINENLGEPRDHPDRPGQLPIMSAADLYEVPNPFCPAPEDKEKVDALFNKKSLLDPTTLPADTRQKVQEALDELFGTPRDPKVEGIEAAYSEKLKLAPDMLKKGSAYYRIHCLHCHGVTGNGRGPTARWVNPHPRDYRQGLFKFQSVDQAAKQGKVLKPRREDLFRTLHDGLEGTAMPSFGLLSRGDLEALVSYVIHLSIRGEAEYVALRVAFDPEEDPVNTLHEYTKMLGQQWAEAQDNAIKPAPYRYKEADMKASVQRGRALFLADEAKLKEHFPGADLNALKVASCVTCHKDYGRQAAFKFDNWGTLIKPTDLTRGIFRGGRSPVDLYYRIHSGVNGSGMITELGKKLELRELYPSERKDLPNIDPIWDLVNFVRTLPYPAMREKYGIQIN